MPLTSCGYEYKRIHGHPLASKRGLVLVHRLVWFESNGPIPDGHIVHHINGIRTDNRIENLEVKSRSIHMAEHYLDGKHLAKFNGPRSVSKVVCGVCGLVFYRKTSKIRSNRKQSPDGMHIHSCSNKCMGRIISAYRLNDIRSLKAYSEKSYADTSLIESLI